MNSVASTTSSHFGNGLGCVEVMNVANENATTASVHHANGSRYGGAS